MANESAKVKDSDTVSRFNLNNLSTITKGMTENLPNAINDILNSQLSNLDRKFENLRVISNNTNSDTKTKEGKLKFSADKNNSSNIEQDLASVYSYYNKYYSTLKDYETIPILVPEVTRILTFLTNEVISPDSQNEKSFIIYVDDKDTSVEIDKIRKDHSMDKLLRTVIQKRFRLGRVYYLVQGYNTLFNLVAKLGKGTDGMISESVMNMDATEFLNEFTSKGISKGTNVNVTVKLSDMFDEDELKDENAMFESTNVSMEYGSVYNDYMGMLKGISSELNESYQYSMRSFMSLEKGETNVKTTVGDLLIYESYINKISEGTILNESGIASNDGIYKSISEAFNRDESSIKSKVIDISKKLTAKDNLRRANKIELDPARVFPLKANDRVIGYFYYEETPQGFNSFNELIVKNLKNGKIGKDALKEAEERITKNTAEKMIQSIKTDLNLSEVSDIDLFYDYVFNSKILDTKTKFKFYYKDDVIDLSRGDGSLLINSVYHAKLAAYLTHANIVTKLTKGRDREIYTVTTGAGLSVSPYLNSAMDTLASSNDGVYRALSGPVAKVFNPIMNSTIIIPNDGGTSGDKFISADIIQGQDVEMDMEMIKYLIRKMIISYGLDPAIIDLTDGNIDFAKTVTMMNKEMLILNINEQLDIAESWSKLILAVLYEEGSDSLREKIDNNKVTVKLYKPKSLLLELVQNEINSAKAFAEMIVEINPILNTIKDDDELSKKIAIYEIVKDQVSLDFAKYDDITEDALTVLYNKLILDIAKINSSRASINKDKDISEVEGGEEEDY